jgi:hypothetical protein
VVEQNLAASTQNVAYSALLFLYRNVLHMEVYPPSNTTNAPSGRPGCRRCSPRVLFLVSSVSKE